MLSNLSTEPRAQTLTHFVIVLLQRANRTSSLQRVMELSLLLQVL